MIVPSHNPKLNALPALVSRAGQAAFAAEDCLSTETTIRPCNASNKSGEGKA